MSAWWRWPTTTAGLKTGSRPRNGRYYEAVKSGREPWPGRTLCRQRRRGLGCGLRHHGPPRLPRPAVRGLAAGGLHDYWPTLAGPEGPMDVAPAARDVETADAPETAQATQTEAAKEIQTEATPPPVAPRAEAAPAPLSQGKSSAFDMSVEDENGQRNRPKPSPTTTPRSSSPPREFHPILESVWGRLSARAYARFSRSTGS
jgi:hypothetical protein